jgi:hypothetical protein
MHLWQRAFDSERCGANVMHLRQCAFDSNMARERCDAPAAARIRLGIRSLNRKGVKARGNEFVSTSTVSLSFPLELAMPRVPFHAFHSPCSALPVFQWRETLPWACRQGRAYGNRFIENALPWNRCPEFRSLDYFEKKILTYFHIL